MTTADPNINTPVGLITPQMGQVPLQTYSQRLAALHGSSDFSGVDKIPMYRSQPFGNTSALADQANGFSSMRLYATDNARSLYTTTMDGFQRGLVPPHRVSNEQNSSDLKLAGLTGQVFAAKGGLDLQPSPDNEMEDNGGNVEGE